MGSYYARPTIVNPEFGHPILRNQSLWLVADRDSPPKDLLNRGYAAMAVGFNGNPRGGSHASTNEWPSSAWGGEWYFNPSAAQVMDLGTANLFLSSATQPCSFLWIEKPEHISIAQDYGTFDFRISPGSVGTLVIGRNSSPSGYTLFCGVVVPAGTVTGVVSSLIPNLTAGVNSVCLVVANKGCGSVTPSDWAIYVGGSINISGFATGTQTFAPGDPANNTMGQGPGRFSNLYLGIIGNVRVWNRALSGQECHDLIADPYLGAIRTQRRRMA